MATGNKIALAPGQMPGTVLIRTTSHRSRGRIRSLLGELPRGWFSYAFQGDFREVPEERLHDVLRVRGVRRARVDVEKLIQYGAFSAEEC